ncbi:CGNR zinc finger domain-containing protein [Streptomyces phaeochromogenes]|uniref:CGNR zinc finger domain-containing protein n=1 Tax=Streptomyces phaeochromogenes TaxID=1923 RepID=UPI002E28814F|nr:CGNR zinc finger domain-containing protein [Streptomyces phaeochromogenes]
MAALSDDWSTRHSVLANARRTAALINALSGTGDREPQPKPAAEAEAATVAVAVAVAVAEVLREYGESEPVELAPDDVVRMRVAALLLREVFAAEDVDAAAAALNRLLAEQTGPLRLTSHGGSAPWHPHLDSHDDAPWDEWFLTSSCLALTVLLWDHQRPPGGLCASLACRNVYITSGPGPARRYCSRRCATRERVAAHRRGQRATDTKSHSHSGSGSGSGNS